VLQVVLLNALVHVVDLSWNNNTDVISEEAGPQGDSEETNSQHHSPKHMFSNTEHTTPGQTRQGRTWNEETRVDRPNICAVRVIVVSLSNMPCVSIRSTASFSPPAALVVRMNGSDHIQMPAHPTRCRGQLAIQ
jgi:hypothetical protein